MENLGFFTLMVGRLGFALSSWPLTHPHSKNAYARPLVGHGLLLRLLCMLAFHGKAPTKWPQDGRNVVVDFANGGYYGRPVGFGVHFRGSEPPE